MGFKRNELGLQPHQSDRCNICSIYCIKLFSRFTRSSEDRTTLYVSKNAVLDTIPNNTEAEKLVQQYGLIRINVTIPVLHKSV